LKERRASAAPERQHGPKPKPEPSPVDAAAGSQVQILDDPFSLLVLALAKVMKANAPIGDGRAAERRESRSGSTPADYRSRPGEPPQEHFPD